MSTDMEKLKQLKQLKDQGLLDDDEYMERRTAIIDRMTSDSAGPKDETKKSPRKAPAPPSNASSSVSPRATSKPTVRESAKPAAQPSSRETTKPAAQAPAARATVVPELSKKPEVKERAPDECWECGERLFGKVVTTNNHNYHMDCFKCSVCQIALPGKTFFPQGSEVVCAKHVSSGSDGTCPKCTETIDGDFVEADGSKYHEGCFVCNYGGCSLDGGWARGADGEPYCFLHINMLSNAMCVECNKMITADLVTFNGEKRHGRCFVCAFCQNPIGKGKFYKFDEQAFCFECHRLQFILVLVFLSFVFMFCHKKSALCREAIKKPFLNVDLLRYFSYPSLLNFKSL